MEIFHSREEEGNFADFFARGIVFSYFRVVDLEATVVFFLESFLDFCYMIQTSSDCLFFITSARGFQDFIDPEGVFSGMILESFSIAGKEDKFSLSFCFNKGENKVIVKCGESGFISGVSWESPSAVPVGCVKGCRTVAEALGDLSTLPEGFKVLLSPVGAGSGGSRVRFSPGAFMGKARTLLSEGIECGWDGFFDGDGVLIVNYLYNKGMASVVNVLFKRTFTEPEGVACVRVGMTVDVFGFRNREVKVDVRRSDLLVKCMQCYDAEGSSASLGTARVICGLFVPGAVSERRLSERIGVPRGV